MASVFTYTPKSARKAGKPKVKAIEFGNGYEQIYAEGINANKKDWRLTFVKSTTVADAIETFFDSNYTTYFWWTPPGASAAIAFNCRQWDVDYSDPNSRRITAVFKQWTALTEDPPAGLQMTDDLEMVDDLEMTDE